jgi:hypothetical protein
MSYRPAPSGLTNDTSEGRAHSWASPPSSLDSDITSVRRGDYPGLVRFINQHPWIADTQEINRLLTQASVHETAGESSLAVTCVHHALALRKWRNLGPQEAAKYFESLADGGESTTEFMRNVTKVLTALPQKRAHAPTATGVTQSQTRVFRENDERPYYIDKQGNLLQPASNRRNPKPSRTLSDPATDDRNIREHGRTLAWHQLDPSSRQRQENPEPSRTLSDPAIDDRNIREHGRTLVRHNPVLSSRHIQESPDSTSGRMPQGEPELPLKSYFLPKEGINDDVIQRDITRHLGATASARPHVYNVSFRK